MKHKNTKTYLTTWKVIPMICIIISTVTLSGCTSMPSSLDMADDLSEEQLSGQVTIGSHLTSQNTNEKLTLSDHMDALSADGLYYASWVAGNSVPYENSDKESVTLYDAQLYLLAGEFKSSEAAQENMNNWLAAGKSNYDVISEENIECNGQTYSMITYHFTNTENPYDHGVSVFGVYEDMAVCMELTCVEGYNEDLRQMLTGFLENCTYR